jgi:hypothetical protein
MIDADYYRSLAREFDSLKNRVRSLIRGAHWLTDGEWKESVLRSLLRRHLPRTSEVGRGFVVSSDGNSTQIDILIYDATKPVLFRDGDLVFVTSDAVEAVIEVKTSVGSSDLRRVLDKLADNASFVRQHGVREPFVGLFAYDDCTSKSVEPSLDALRDAVAGDWSRLVHCVCLGGDRLIRYWELSPLDRGVPYEKWRAYEFDGEAQGYFVHNVIEGISPRSVAFNTSVWFPKENKETRFIADRAVGDSFSVSGGIVDPMALAVISEILRRQLMKRDIPHWFSRGALHLMERLGGAEISALAKLLDEIREIHSETITVLGLLRADRKWEAFQSSVPNPCVTLSPFQDAERLFGEIKRAGLGRESAGYGTAAHPAVIVLEQNVVNWLREALRNAQMSGSASD